MERCDALASLNTAQKAANDHLVNARPTLRELPHGVEALVPTNIVMGNLGRETTTAPIPTPVFLAEEIYSGSSTYGATLAELMPPIPTTPDGRVVPHNPSAPQWDSFYFNLSVAMGVYIHNRIENADKWSILMPKCVHLTSK